jgi:hypothetical protein
MCKLDEHIALFLVFSHYLPSPVKNSIEVEGQKGEPREVASVP